MVDDACSLTRPSLVASSDENSPGAVSPLRCAVFRDGHFAGEPYLRSWVLALQWREPATARTQRRQDGRRPIQPKASGLDRSRPARRDCAAQRGPHSRCSSLVPTRTREVGRGGTGSVPDMVRLRAGSHLCRSRPMCPVQAKVRRERPSLCAGAHVKAAALLPRTGALFRKGLGCFRPARTLLRGLTRASTQWFTIRLPGWPPQSTFVTPFCRRASRLITLVWFVLKTE